MSFKRLIILPQKRLGRVAMQFEGSALGSNVVIWTRTWMWIARRYLVLEISSPGPWELSILVSVRRSFLFNFLGLWVLRSLCVLLISHIRRKVGHCKWDAHSTLFSFQLAHSRVIADGIHLIMSGLSHQPNAPDWCYVDVSAISLPNWSLFPSGKWMYEN